MNNTPTLFYPREPNPWLSSQVELCLSRISLSFASFRPVAFLIANK